MQLKLHIVTIEDLVPQEHFLRRLEAALDLSFVYHETEKLYSRRYGRPPIDPVVLVKHLLVGYLYGIPSERQIEQRIQTDVALRWYLGLDLLDRVPDHSTISQLRRRKPSFRKVFRRLFEEVVEQCIRRGLASGRLVATDSTHVKANASPASEHLVEAAQKPGAYWERLDAYEEEALEELDRRTRAGKTGRKRRQKGRSRQVKSPLRYDRKWVSRTDPESGRLNRPGKPKGPHYLSHQTVDCDHGIILDVTVTSGEVNDAVPYLRQIEHIHQEIIPIRAAVADATYDLPLFHRVLRDHGIRFYVRPMPRSAAALDGVPGSPFLYDEENDFYTCPGGKTLRLQNLKRNVGGLHWVLRRLSHESAVPGKGTGQTPGTQLLLERDPGGSEGAGQPDVPEGAAQAADLERGHLCRAEVGAQAWPAPATRLKGSGGPLPLVSDRMEPEADGQMDRVTP